MGDGTAWGGHHFCKVEIRRDRHPYPPQEVTMKIIVSRDKLEAAELALAEAKKRDDEIEVKYHKTGDTERVLSSTLISRFIERT